MFKLLRYLKNSKLSVIAILALLIAQAFCDLALPQYTADIVDVGIGQQGIDSAVPERMRTEALEELSLFLSEEEFTKVEAAYDLDADGVYVRNTDKEETLEELDGVLSEPMVLVSFLKNPEELAAMMPAGMDASQASQMNPDTLKQMLDAGLITKEELLEIRTQAVESMGDMGESLISQRAVLVVQEEYEALGVDMEKVQTNYLWKTGGKMLGLSVLMMAASILVGLLSARVAAKIGKELREKVFKKVVSFSHAEIDQFSTASLITRSTNDIQQVQFVSVMILRMVLYAPIIGIGGIVKVAGTRTGMSWIIVVAVVSVLTLVMVLMKVAMPKFKMMQKLVDRLNLVSREILTGVSVIRAFSREAYEEKRFDKANNDLMGTQLFTGRVMNIMMPMMMLIMNGITLLIVWFGAKGIDLGTLQVGDMLAFMTYTMQIVMSFLMITMISVMLPRAGVAADRIEEVLTVEPTISDKEEVKDAELEDAKGVVRFNHVCFRYPNADEDAISGIDFEAKPGETTAIIGSTGCGKSTLIHLIPRFYDVTEGSVTIDGVDIRDISQEKLRDLLGFVPQKAVLFSGDIESNLKFGGDEITDEKMIEAARIAQAEEFISEKAEGYQSPIAQGGTNVSGGQKQRLSIARAIAKNPKIFLFDDSFSALDYKTDVELRKALNEKISDATVIIVAQRISTILHADQILVLDDGRIVGKGTHEELLESCEAYQEIARSQLSEAELKGGNV